MMYFLKKINHINVLIFFFLNIFLLPVYPSNLKPLLIVLLLLASVFYARKNKTKFNLKLIEQNRSFYINTSLFFILGIGLLYTSNIDIGASFLFRMSPLLIFPIIFKCINDTTDISQHLILKAYSFFYVATVVLFFSFFVYFYFNGDITANFLRNYNERINNLLGSYNVHPLYASIYVSIALILSVNLHKERLLSAGIIVFFNILLMLNLILLARKSALIIMFIFFLIYQLKLKKTQRIKKIIAVLIIVFLGIFIFIFVPDVSYRFEGILSDFNSNGSIGLRINIFKCSFSSILESPIIGYGIGSLNNVLFECYRSLPEVFNGQYYNTHNQYLGIWLSSGIFGFLSLLLILSSAFKKLIRAKDITSLAILLLFSCMMLIESLLERQDGVILFALFINLFIFKNQEIKAK